jgi:hypothetical protein
LGNIFVFHSRIRPSITSPLLSVMVPELAKTTRWDLPEGPLLGMAFGVTEFPPMTEPVRTRAPYKIGHRMTRGRLHKAIY